MYFILVFFKTASILLTDELCKAFATQIQKEVAFFLSDMKNTFPLIPVLNFLKKQRTFILLESSSPDTENHLSYIFTDPREIISCVEHRRLKACLRKLQKKRSQGYYLCGFLSYEAGYAFCSRFNFKKKYRFPLLWMGVFPKPIIYNHKKNSFSNSPDSLLSAKDYTFKDRHKLFNLKLQTTKTHYMENIKKIRRYIETGDTYQVNYTDKYKFDFTGSVFSLYKDLRDSQRVGYSAFLNTRGFSILSFSPELFFRQKKQMLYTRPMKGTMARGANKEEDRSIKKILHRDPKNCAENIMIVDLLRNDMGKISQTSSVKVTKLFSVETYKTLLQMTSTVQSRLKKDVSLWDLFASLFPSGSVTGAPKIRTMEIIRELESEKRKIYTGTIGYLSPNQEAVFNVAIRTVLVKKNKAEMGVGSGITYSSNPEAEFQECCLKAEFLRRPNFKLIETMLCRQNKKIFLIENHLKRLKRSADFFGFSYRKNIITSSIVHALEEVSHKSAWRLRLLLDIDGNVTIETAPLPLEQGRNIKKKICMSACKTDPNNIFLYHKTTNRKLYDIEYKKYKKLGYYDVIFKNNNGEITEGAISNIILKKKGVFYTPRVSSGILPGVFREYFMRKYRQSIKEKVLREADIKTADHIYCLNSVRGMVEVKLK